MGRLKRWAVRLLLLLVLTAILCVPAAAQTLVSLRIEQIWADMPQLAVCFYAQDADGRPVSLGTLDAQAVDIALGGKKLAVQQAGPYQGDTGYFYLVDISTSMPAAVLDAVKQAIAEHLQAAGGDPIMVLTFGEEIQVLIQPGEEMQQAMEKLQELQPVAGGTRLYDGIARIADYAESNAKALPQRKVVFVVTDGVDLTQGGSTREEVISRAQNAQLAIYTYGVPGQSSESLSALGEIARASGGRDLLLENGQAAQIMRQGLQDVQSVYCITACADSNRIENEAPQLLLQLQADDRQYTASAQARITHWQPDTQAPRIVEVSRAEQGVAVTLSEAVEKGEPFACSLSDGTVTYSVTAVEAPAADRLLLRVEETLYDGTYTLYINGLQDISMEKNRLDSTPFRFTLADGLQRPEPEPETPPSFWRVWRRQIGGAAILLLAVILLLVLFGVRHRKNTAEKQRQAAAAGAKETTPAEKLHIRQRQGMRLQCRVVIAGGVERQIEAILDGSLILGRSAATCDISFEDPLLSRQHCALILSEGQVMVQDLGSSNGTVLNGMPVREPHRVSSGDVLAMGDTKVIVLY